MTQRNRRFDENSDIHWMTEEWVTFKGLIFMEIEFLRFSGFKNLQLLQKVLLLYVHVYFKHIYNYLGSLYM